MSLTSSECQVSKLVNSDTRPTPPTTDRLAQCHLGRVLRHLDERREPPDRGRHLRVQHRSLVDGTEYTWWY